MPNFLSVWSVDIYQHYLYCVQFTGRPQRPQKKRRREPRDPTHTGQKQKTPPEKPRLYIPIYLISKMLLFPGKVSGEGNPPLHPSHQKFLKDRAAP